MIKLVRTLFTLSLFSVSSLALNAQADQAKIDAFVKKHAAQSAFSESEIRSIMEEAEFQQEIIDKISRPAEGTMTWGRYRKIFMTQERIDAGLAFWNEHGNALEQVSKESGVPQEVILGIIGVETYFGKIKGSYRVLDALYTLAFGYPKRSKFFTKELGIFLDIAKEEGLDITQVKGSYAGAMGYSQFMPSSYKAYAKSYDKGGTSDLINSPEDAMASVANYLKVHRWKKGQPITSKASLNREITGLRKQQLRPKNQVNDYTAIGFEPSEKLDETLPATMIILDGDKGTEHWFGLYNFYVITRYNHSKLYAMAVTQLAQEIKKQRENGE